MRGAPLSGPRLIENRALDAEFEADAAAEEAAEADPQPLGDGSGRVSRRMSAALIERHARSQSEYRTTRLISKLEMHLCARRDISTAPAC